MKKRNFKINIYLACFVIIAGVIISALGKRNYAVAQIGNIILVLGLSALACGLLIRG